MLRIPRVWPLLLTLMLAAATAWAADAPRPWPADAFLPVTEQRIALLPFDVQPAWQAYWEKTVARTKTLPVRDVGEHTPNKPMKGGPLGSSYSEGLRLDAPAAWYATEEARLIADRVVSWQTSMGGWTKSGKYSRNRQPADDHRDAWSAGTYDNDATIFELRYLVLVNAAAAESDGPRARAWRESFLRGLEYIFDSQYPNGGFPQVYPLIGWYHDAITYNDDAFIHIVELLRDIGGCGSEFAFVPADQAARARHAVELGLHCLLASQLKSPDGRLSVWGQQHDALTLQPCAARNFEPVAECSLESVELVKFLMSLPHPSPEVIAAIEGAMGWFERTTLHNFRWDRNDPAGTGLLPQAGAPDLWSRFYEIGTGKPIFSERDRMIHYDVSEMSFERRKGYNWFNTEPGTLFPLYARWKSTVLGGKN